MPSSDTELASVMRKLLEDDSTWVSMSRGVVRYRFEIEATITITEDEMAVIQEVLDAR